MAQPTRRATALFDPLHPSRAAAVSGTMRDRPFTCEYAELTAGRKAVLVVVEYASDARADSVKAAGNIVASFRARE